MTLVVLSERIDGLTVKDRIIAGCFQHYADALKGINQGNQDLKLVFPGRYGVVEFTEPPGSKTRIEKTYYLMSVDLYESAVRI